MARTDNIPLKCLLLATFTPDAEILFSLIESTAKNAGVELVRSQAPLYPPAISEETFTEITNADLILMLASSPSPTLFYELGMAHAFGKPVILVARKGVEAPGFFPQLEYDTSAEGMRQLRIRLRDLLKTYAKKPWRLRASQAIAGRQLVLPMVDLDTLGPREFENLCFELLTQMGFRRAEWGKEIKDFDVVATLPKKDPDGFEYEELWLISMGLNAPPEMLLDMATEPDYLMHRLLRSEFIDRFRASFKRGTAVTLLLILRSDEQSEFFEHQTRRLESRLSKGRFPFTVRLRMWDRQQIISLIQQYPQLAHKYFSEEDREQSKSRKTTEEFYREQVALNESLQAANIAIKEEREARIRAERDAIWKDVAFKAAHKLGNPIFALETDLQGLKRRIKDKPEEAADVAEEMGRSIEKAKGIIEQFKSLTRAQEISKRAIDLQPLVQAASRVASENGVEVQVQTNGNSTVPADPTRMTECFDELFANALHWFNKTHKSISILIDSPKKEELPPELDASRNYVRIRFEDNGCGVPVKMKKEIFAPFCTTHPHGTGLGLSVVERIVQGHDGVIREVGKPDEGAAFEIFLPQEEMKIAGS